MVYVAFFLAYRINSVSKWLAISFRSQAFPEASTKCAFFAKNGSSCSELCFLNPPRNSCSLDNAALLGCVLTLVNISLIPSFRIPALAESASFSNPPPNLWKSQPPSMQDLGRKGALHAQEAKQHVFCSDVAMTESIGFFPRKV